MVREEAGHICLIRLFELALFGYLRVVSSFPFLFIFLQVICGPSCLITSLVPLDFVARVPNLEEELCMYDPTPTYISIAFFNGSLS